MTSKVLPPVEISTVSRCRRIFSPSTTQFSLMPLCAFELPGEPLHQDHVGIVHGADGQFRSGTGVIEYDGGQSRAGSRAKPCEGAFPVCHASVAPEPTAHTRL